MIRFSLFFSHNPLHWKKALCVSSLVLSQGELLPSESYLGLHYLLARTKYKALVLG